MNASQSTATIEQQAIPLTEMKEASAANLPAVATSASNGFVVNHPEERAILVGAGIAKIASAISSVMTEIGVIEKRGINNFHHYAYAKMEDVLQTLTPLIAKHGLVIVQTEVSRSMFDADKAIAIEYAFTIAHKDGAIWPDRPRQTGLARCRDSKGGFDDKAMNKAHTAARKYFLLALFQIPTGDEDDADQSGSSDNNADPPKKTYSRRARADDENQRRANAFKQEVIAADDFEATKAFATADLASFPQAIADELRKFVEQRIIHRTWFDLRVAEIDACKTAKEVVAWGDTLVASGRPDDLMQALRDHFAHTLAELRALGPNGSTKPPTAAPLAPEPKAGSISQRAIDARDQKAPDLQEIDPATGLPKFLDRNKPNLEKWLAGLEFAAEAAQTLEALNKSQRELMGPHQGKFDPSTWEKAVAIFRDRANAMVEKTAEAVTQLDKRRDDPGYDIFDEPEWLRELDGALAGCEDIETLSKIKTTVLLPAKSKASEATWAKGKAAYMTVFNNLIPQDLTV